MEERTNPKSFFKLFKKKQPYLTLLTMFELKKSKMKEKCQHNGRQLKTRGRKREKISARCFWTNFHPLVYAHATAALLPGRKRAGVLKFGGFRLLSQRLTRPTSKTGFERTGP
ncbi:hypothetical protein T08_13059 [Trichinella sp. T8]|nr:hypothetical protein T08_13059 [Trichinella sp. T8]